MHEYINAKDHLFNGELRRVASLPPTDVRQNMQTLTGNWNGHTSEPITSFLLYHSCIPFGYMQFTAYSDCALELLF